MPPEGSEWMRERSQTFSTDTIRAQYASETPSETDVRMYNGFEEEERAFNLSYEIVRYVLIAHKL